MLFVTRMAEIVSALMIAVLLVLALVMFSPSQAAAPVVVQQGSDCRLSEFLTWTHDDSIPITGFTVWASRFVDVESGRRSLQLDALNLQPGVYKIYILSNRDNLPSTTSGGPVLLEVQEPVGGFCTP